MVKFGWWCGIVGILVGVVLGSGAAALTPPDSPVRAQVSSDTTTLDAPLEWSIVVSGDEGSELPQVEPSNDFTVDFHGHATSLQFVNGRFRREFQFRYRLTPRREGALATPRATVTVQGRAYEVASLAVTVKPASGGARPEERAAWVAQTIDSPTAFVGEQLINTIEIVTSRQLFEAQFGDLTYAGFRHIDVGDEQRSTRLVNGVPHTVITLTKALFPLKAGDLTIPSRVLRAKVRVPRRSQGSNWPFGGIDPFGDDLLGDFFGGGELRTVELRTDALGIVVKPLPPLPAGSAVWGSGGPIVGHTGINVQTTETAVQFGDAVSLTVKVVSEGNISLIETLPFTPSPDYKVYQDPPRTEVIDSGGTVITEKSFRVSIVPQRGGAVVVPPLALTYFDPVAEVYKTAASLPVGLEVAGGPTPEPERPEDPRTTPTAEVPGEPSDRYTPLGFVDRLAATISPAFLLFIGATLAACAIVGAVARGAYRRRRSLASAWAEVAHSRAPEELRRALRNALCVEYGLTPDASVRDILGALARSGASGATEFAVTTVFDSIDRALYSGHVPPDFGRLRADAVALRGVLPRPLRG